MRSDKTPPKVTTPPDPVSRWVSFLKRHLEVLGYFVTIILPLILKNRRRPVLFARHSGMGDIICTLPAARELLKRHPDHPVIYNCHRNYAEVPRIAGITDIVTHLEPIGLIGHWYSWWLAGFYNFAHGDDLPDSSCKEPMVAEFCKQFQLPAIEEHPEMTAGKPAHAKVRQVLAAKGLVADSLILIHSGPSWPVREWPLENWERLIAGLRQRGHANIGQLGVSQHLNFGKVEMPGIPGTCSLINQFSIEECFAAISQARLFVGIDSGLLHIAASTRTPAIGIFGMTLPEFRFSRSFRRDFVVNRVECAGCEHRKPRLHWVTGCPNDIQCMKTLTVDSVLAACLEKLNGNLPTT